MKAWNRQCLVLLACAGIALSLSPRALGQTCTTQSQMEPAERDALAAAALSLAQRIQANDRTGVQNSTIPEFAADFSGIGGTVAEIAPKLAGKNPEVEQVYVLDATGNTKNPDGSFNDAEFICTLNKGKSEADFSIRSLPPGRYAFTMVEFPGQSPWELSMLLRQDGAAAPWKLAGLFPKETSAAGHDGLWYWSQGRAMAASKHPWVAYLYYQQAQQLLQPAVFVSSTHLENLRSESTSAVPPEVANGIGPDSPLVVKGTDGSEYRITSITPDNGLHGEKLDIALHMPLDPSADAATIQKRNREAMSAFLAQHPELREPFHGVWVYADAPDRLPVATVAAMNDIH